MEIDDKRRLFNESLITNSSAAASSVDNGGAGGTHTKTSDATQNDSPQGGTEIQRQGQEQERERGEKAEKEDNDEKGDRRLEESGRQSWTSQLERPTTTILLPMRQHGIDQLAMPRRRAWSSVVERQHIVSEDYSVAV